MANTSPNVLMICVDHWSGLLLHRAGHPDIITPTLDQLADNGTMFTRAYASTPTCIPARRSIMTGTTARTHGDRVFNEQLPMDPVLKTMPQAFRDAGYQAYAVGKLHVYPQRDRIGFDDACLDEEGRHHLGMSRDDYEMFLSDAGYGGQEQAHGMGVNSYTVRPWHLDETLHQTYWTTKQLCRTIQRRDPSRPAFWYCSYSKPHPPITPLQCYLDMYDRPDLVMPVYGEWLANPAALPWAIQDKRRSHHPPETAQEIRLARAGFYAQCTYIDHQIRLLIGTLREEGLLDNTIMLFTSDHGDMLGDHGMWAKMVMYEPSVRIPMLLVDKADYGHAAHHHIDSRLCGHEDIMPTLLEMCGIPVPGSVEGISMVSDRTRDSYYCEHCNDSRANRMVRWDNYKLIYYPVGNHFQLFDLAADPAELVDLAQRPACRDILRHGEELLLSYLYGEDLAWIEDGCLRGLPARAYQEVPDRGLRAQRGWRV
jgi:arylsulfatase A-like enzyme